MRKGVRIVVFAAGGVVAGLFALLANFYLLAPKRRPAADLKAPATAEAVERGRYLANNLAGCMTCHSETAENLPGDPIRAGRLGSGRDFGRPEGLPGLVRAGNLTSHPDGLGRWTDGEIVRAVREGIGKDGRPLFPFMPYQVYGRNLTDADALALVAYLRTLPPLAGSPPRTEIDFPVSMFSRTAPKPVVSPVAPLADDPLARGKRLLELGGCADCHDSFDDRHEPVPGQYLAGGMAFNVPGKGRVYASNLTPDPASGIGAWTDEELLRVFRTGTNRRGRPLYAMPWAAYTGLQEQDLQAIVTALRALPPVSKPVPPPTFQD